MKRPGGLRALDSWPRFSRRAGNYTRLERCDMEREDMKRLMAAAAGGVDAARRFADAGVCVCARASGISCVRLVRSVLEELDKCWGKTSVAARQNRAQLCFSF